MTARNTIFGSTASSASCGVFGRQHRLSRPRPQHRQWHDLRLRDDQRQPAEHRPDARRARRERPRLLTADACAPSRQPGPQRRRSDLRIVSRAISVACSAAAGTGLRRRRIRARAAHADRGPRRDGRGSGHGTGDQLRRRLLGRLCPRRVGRPDRDAGAGLLGASPAGAAATAPSGDHLHPDAEHRRGRDGHLHPEPTQRRRRDSGHTHRAFLLLPRHPRRPPRRSARRARS